MSDLCLSLREVLNMVNSLTDGWGKKTQLLNGWMGWVRAWPVVNWAGLVCKCVSRASVGMPVFWQRMVSNQRAQNGCLTNPEFSCVLFGTVTKILGIKRGLSTRASQLWSLLGLFSRVQLTLCWNENTLIASQFWTPIVKTTTDSLWCA